MNEEKRTKLNALIDKLLSVSHMAVELDAQPRTFGSGSPLTRAEVHTVSDIAATPGISVTALAEHQGVTKGAVSQMVSRLKSKGLVRKSRGVGRTLLLYVTDLGAAVHAEHRKLHDEMCETLAALYPDRESVDRDIAALDRLREALQRFARRGA